jgi:hypothetical protein
MAYSAVNWSSRDIVAETKLDQMTENDSVFNSAITTGWNIDTDTWVYVSAVSFKVEGKDVTATFTKGTKIRYKQGGAYEYGIVASSAFSTDTTVTLIANTDYALASAVITDAGYSYVENPQGFPTVFAYTPTVAGFSGTPVVTRPNFYVTGNICHLLIADITGTSNNASFTFTAPVVSTKASAMLSLCGVKDNDTFSTVPGHTQCATGSAVIKVSQAFFDAGWSASGAIGAWFLQSSVFEC